MLDALKVLPRVQLHRDRELSGELQRALYRGDTTLTNPRGVRVENQEPIENRLAMIHNCMVHDSLFKSRGADESLLGIMNEKSMALSETKAICVQG